MATKIWNGATADWNVGTDWTGGLPGSLDLAVLSGTAPYLVTIGTSASAHEFEQPGSLSITDNAATLAIASGSTLAVVSLLDLAAGTLALGAGGVLKGGTLDLAGGTLTASGGTLAGVTILGGLTVGYPATPIFIEGGLTLDTAAGASGGTLTLNDGQLDLLDNETLDNATILATNYIDSIDSTGSGSLTLGSHLTLIAATTDQLVLDSTTLINNGTIEVAAGADLLLEFSNSFVNNGVVSVAAGGALSLDGPLTATQLKNIAAGITDLGALQVEGALQLGGTILTIPATGSLSNVSFDSGSVNGGTLVNAGSLTFYDEDLSGLSLFGPLVIKSGGYADIGVGTTLLSAAGGPGGTIIAATTGQLDIDTGETLSNTLIEDSGSGLSILSGSTLVFGTGLDLAVASFALVNATTLFNAGTIAVAPGAAVDLSTATVFNTGTIAVGAGGTLELDANQYGYGYGATLDYNGALPVLGAGATLIVGSKETTAQLLALLGTQTNETVEILGTLLNTGTSLVVGSGDAISHLILSGDVVGGSIDNTGGVVTLGYGTLAGVTFLGPAAIAGYNTTVDVFGGLTLHGTDGVSPGSLAISGYSDGLVFGDTETFDNASLAVGSNANGYVALDSIYGTTLTLGAHLALADTGDLNITATTLVNAGSLAVTGAGNDLALYANSIANTGVISIGSGAVLALDLPGYNANPLPVAISDPGSIGFAPGATLELGGVTTTATLATLLGTEAGVTTLLLGTLQNALSTIDALAGAALGTIVLDGDLVGGTLIGGAGGTVDLGTGTLDGVIVQGGLTLAGSTTLVDGVAFSGIGGAGPATLTDSYYSSGIRLLDAESLANAVIPLLAGQLTVSTATTTLAVAASTTIALAGAAGVAFDAPTIVSAGTVFTTGTNESVLFGSGTIVQGGVMTIGSADVLGLDVGGQYTQIGLGDQLSLTGSIALATGATLELGEQQNTMQLQTLLGQISHAGVAVDLLGTLQNAGTSLAIAPGLLGNLTVSGDIVGGTITQNGGTLDFTGGTLDGVQVLSPVTLTSGILYLVDNTSFDTPAGAPGGTIVSNGDANIRILDAETLDHVTIAATGGFLELTEEAPTAGPPLALGASAVFEVQSGLQLDSFGPEIVSAATFFVAGNTIYPYSYLDLDAPTIVNTGSILVAAFGTLEIDPGQDAPLTLVNSGEISLAPGATLFLGGAETTAQLNALLGSLVGPGVGVGVVLDGSIDNIGTVLDLGPGGTLGTVVLEGVIDGGTVIDADPTIDFRGVDLDNLVWQGPLTLVHASDAVSLQGTTSVQSAGGGPGMLALAGAYQQLIVGGASLDQLGFVVSGQNDSLSIGTLTLGPSLQATISGQLVVGGIALTNDATIAVAGKSAELQIETNSFVNNGIITVGSGDVLALQPDDGVPGLPFTENGSVSLAAGATLEIGGTLTTAQLLALLGSISNPAVTVELTGTVVNTGATLGGAASPLFNSLILDADVIGGVVQAGTSGLRLNGGTLDGVTWLGPVPITTTAVDYTIQDGLTLESATGTLPGFVQLFGFDDILDFVGSQTLNNVLVSDLGFDNVIDAMTLTLGAGVTVNVSNLLKPTELDFLQLYATTLVNAGTISVTGTNAGLQLNGTSLVNNGIISIGSGDVLELSPSYGGPPLTIGGTGAVSLAPGAVLEIGGTLTTAQLLALIGSFEDTGAAIEVVGTVINSGTVLDAAAGGPLADLILDGDIIGGTIDSDTGTLSVLGGTFTNVTYEGTLNVQGVSSRLAVLGSLTLENTAGGLPGTIYAGSSKEYITLAGSGALSGALTGALSGSATLANTVLVGTNSDFGILGPLAGTLDLAPSFTSELTSGIVLFGAADIVNAGTLLLTHSGALEVFESSTFTNTGTIIAGAGSGVDFLAAQSFSNPGSISLATGALLGLGGTFTTGQFTSFVGSLVTNPGVLVGVGDGTLINSGSTLTIAPTGSLSDVGFVYAGVVGGTILDHGTAFFYGPAVFDNVSWVGGPIVLTNARTDLELLGTTSIVSGIASPETIDLLGSKDIIQFNAAALEFGLPTPAISPSQTLSNASVVLGVAGIAQHDTFELVGPGTLTLAPSVTIAATGTAVIEANVFPGVNAVLINQGTINASNGLLFTANAYTASNYYKAGAGTIINTGVINAGGGTTYSEALGITGAFVNTGLITVSGQDRFLINGSAGSSFSNTGSIVIAGGATLDFLTSALQAGTIVMADAAETLRIDATGSVAASVLGFTAGDTIDLAQVPDNVAMPATGTFTAGMLDIFSGGSLAATFALPSYPYTNTSLVVASDGLGGTRITTTTACFLAGTRIRTSAGDVAVEALQVGMRVPTLLGEARPIIWIGQRRIDCARHRRPETVTPIRVCAGAFGAGRPQRDLLLSPDHAVWQDGVLIPIQYLVNGVSIRRETAGHAHYFHVELDAHAVLFAEGLAAESYLDTGNRSDFEGGVALSLFPEFVASACSEACAPLCVAGPIVAAVRQRLFASLDSIEVGLKLLDAGGKPLRLMSVKGQVQSYAVPALTREVAIVSETGVPAEIDPLSTDRRRLGVAIGSLVLDGRLIGLSDPRLGQGFHALEPGRRWTDGAARLVLGKSLGARVLQVQILERARVRPQAKVPVTDSSALQA